MNDFPNAKVARRWPKVLITALLAVVLGGGVLCGRWLRTRASAWTSAPGLDGTVSEGESAGSSIPPSTRGDIVFQLHCAKCHGSEGHGDEEAMARMRPPPRDFASRPWRFSVDADAIRRVTLEGIPGTAMPAFRSALLQSDLEAVVTHTYRLATTEPIVNRYQSPLDEALVAASFIPEIKGRLASELKLSDAAGNTRTLADEQGRIVLLNFWGASCSHCLASMPQLQTLADRWKSQGLTVLNICADADDAMEGQSVVDRVSPTTRIWIDDTGLANAQFGVQVMPTIWLIDAEGKLLARAHGMQDWAAPAVDEIIKRCLGQVSSRTSPAKS